MKLNIVFMVSMVRAPKCATSGGLIWAEQNYCKSFYSLGLNDFLRDSKISVFSGSLWLFFAANDLECESINIIAEQQYNCMFNIESIDGCKYVDSYICPGIDFRGNISSLNQVPCYLFE